MDEVSKVLVVGLGGIGGKIVGKMVSILDESAKRNCRAVCFDTNAHDLSELKKEFGAEGVQTSSTQLVSEYIRLHPDYTKWFMENPLVACRDMQAGAGQVRQLSRLAADDKEDAIRNVLTSAIDDLMRADGGAYTSPLKVIVCCSITGGTGAGLVVQLPFMIREIARKSNNINSLIIRGLFVGPDICAALQRNELNRKSIYCNAYAVIKEIDAFNDVQLKNLEDIPFELPHYEKRDGTTNANPVPYDFVFLLNKSNIRSENLDTKSIANYFDAASEIAYQQLFTGLTSDLFGSEDNMILNHVQAHGMDRYGSAGTSHAEFPVEDIIKYFSVRWNNENLSENWFLIDREIDVLKKNQKASASPDAPEVDEYKEYIRLFDEYARNKKAFAKMKKKIEKVETVNINGISTQKITNLYKECFNAIKYSVVQSFRDSVEKNSAPALSIIELAISVFKNSPKEIDAAFSNLEAIQTTCENEKNKLRYILPDEIIPIRASADDLSYPDPEKGIWNKMNIPALIHQQHPMVARYILCYLIDQINIILPVLDSIRSSYARDLNNTNINSQKLRELYNELFANKQKKEDAYKEKALKRIKKSGKPPIMKSDDKLSAGIQEYEALLKPALDQHYFKKYSAICPETELIDPVTPIQLTYYEADLLFYVLLEVKTRLESLYESYSAFFKALPGYVKEKQKEEVMLLHEHNGVAKNGVIRGKGTKFICATETCKDRLYDEISTSIDEANLPEESLHNLFSAIYKKGVIEYQNTISGKKIKLTKEQERAQERGMSQLYEKNVLPVLVEEVRAVSKDALDIGILKAILKEYEINNYDPEVDIDAPKLTDVEQKSIISDTLKQLRNLAAPMFSANGTADRSEYVYFCFNPKGFVDAGVNEKTAFDSIKLHSTDGFITRLEFNPNMIYAYRACYLYRASEIDVFKPGSEARTYYDERIDNIRYHYQRDMNADTLQEYICPHLDKRWCESFYLPDIDPDIAYREKYNGYLSFLLSLIYDYAFLAQNRNADTVGAYHWQTRGMPANSFLTQFGEDKNLNSDYIEMLRYCRGNSVFNSIVVDGIDKSVREYEKIEFSKGDKFENMRPMHYLYESTDAPGFQPGEINNTTPNVLEIIERTGSQAADSWFTMTVLLRVICKYLIDYCDYIHNGNIGLADKEYDKFVKLLVLVYLKCPNTRDDLNKADEQYDYKYNNNPPIIDAKKVLLSMIFRHEVKDVDALTFKDIYDNNAAGKVEESEFKKLVKSADKKDFNLDFIEIAGIRASVVRNFKPEEILSNRVVETKDTISVGEY